MGKPGKFISLVDLKNEAKSRGVTTANEYNRRYREIPGAPSNPHLAYKNKGWESYADLFGKSRSPWYGKPVLTDEERREHHYLAGVKWFNKNRNNPERREKARIRSAQRYIDNPDKLREQARKRYHRKDEERYFRKMARRAQIPRRNLLWRAKNNAKARGIEIRLTLADIPEIPKYCPIFPWIELVFRVGHHVKGQPCPDESPSLDRINSRLGYIPGNLQVTSWRANKIKNDATDRELIALGEYARTHQREPLQRAA
jgi:hypothetical protein